MMGLPDPQLGPISPCRPVRLDCRLAEDRPIGFYWAATSITGGCPRALTSRVTT